MEDQDLQQTIKQQHETIISLKDDFEFALIQKNEKESNAQSSSNSPSNLGKEEMFIKSYEKSSFMFIVMHLLVFGGHIQYNVVCPIF